MTDEGLAAIQREIEALVDDGLIEPTGEVRARRDGSLAPVYRATARGREVYEELFDQGLDLEELIGEEGKP